MSTKRKILSKIRTESILIGILHLIGLLSLYNDADHTRRGRPYVYPTTVILRCFVVRIWFRIPSNNALHYFLSTGTTHHRRIIKSCGLYTLPDRRTFDRRFKIIPAQYIVSAMGLKFLRESLAESYVGAADSAIIRCKKVWHKSDMEDGRIPVSGIDTNARWGFSKSTGWAFGYKLHMSCSTGKLAVPLTADVGTANIYDPHRYDTLTDPLAGLVPYMVADSLYSSEKLYYSSKEKGITLVCPIKRYRHTKGIRLKRYHFFRSGRGQKIIRRRNSIERMFDRIKDTFGISYLPVKGERNVTSYVLMCVFVYQIAIYYNCMMGVNKPQCVKHMLGN
jgi:hypothetical protein